MATALPDWLKICISTIPLVRPADPVSVTLADMFEVPPLAMVDGMAVADEVNVRDEVTVIVPADAFQLHCCQVEEKTPASTV